MGRPKLDSKTKFWLNVDKRLDNECWVFLGGKDKDGYGQFWAIYCLSYLAWSGLEAFTRKRKVI